MHDRRARFVSNYDGDSVTMTLDQDFFDTKTIKIRLANVWAPESDDPGGSETEAFVYNWCLTEIARVVAKNTWPFVVHTSQTKSGTAQMTFARFVATVMSADGQRCLNTDVMKFIVDRGYDGGTGAPIRTGD